MPRASYHFYGSLAYRMASSRWLWLAVPLVGIGELGAHVYYSQQAPREQAWAELAPVLESSREAGDLVVIAPEWAEPLARQAFGEALMPLADVARSDDSGYAHALEVGALGQRAVELAGWRELEQHRQGEFLLRRLENPHYEPTLYAFIDHLEPDRVFVSEWNGEAEHACAYSDHARVSSGGLGGHVTYPKRRFSCTGGEAFFVGITVIDDQRYRPRRCIFAHPPINALLHLRFPNVPLGKRIRGYGGLSYLLSRDGGGSPVEFSAYIDGKELGRRLFSADKGYAPFEFKLEPGGPTTAEVTLEVQSQGAADREFCFVAEMR